MFRITPSIRKKVKGAGVLAAHLGITGINKIRELMTTSEKSRLLVLSEFREELGSFRYKLAKLLNNHFGTEKVKRCTSDIGMAIRFEGGDIKIMPWSFISLSIIFGFTPLRSESSI